MSERFSRVYDLAMRALDEQERRVEQLHARLAPVLAAGGLGITLLARPAFHGPHPTGPVETTSVIVALTGIAVAVAATAYVLLASRLSFEPNVLSSTAVARRHTAADLDQFYLVMTALLDEQRIRNRPSIERLQGAFTVTLCGMLVGVCGLAIAAAVA